MDRLFKKRTNSTSEAAHHRPSTLKKATSSHALSEKAAGKQKSVYQENSMEKNATARSGKAVYGSSGVGDVAPSLDVDIRNSLILPGLSQRFSVLLPSLSSVPETSIRDLLASQRARHDGPSLTIEEEELLFAEMRSNTNPAYSGESRKSPPASIKSIFGWSPSKDTSSLSTSTSSPSLLSTSTSTDDHPPPSSAPLTHTSFWSNTSPPPTSTSFTSFQTFGVHDVKTKSYGFSGGSGMRDGEYIRKVKKSASGRNLSGSAGGGTPTKENSPSPWTTTATMMPVPMISPERANAYFTKRSDSPSGSEGTATPTSALHPVVSNILRPTRGQSPASSSSLNLPLPPQPPVPRSLPPPTPTPTSPEQRYGKKRQSLLAGLSAAQVKRISMALGEIEGKLQRGGEVNMKAQATMKGLNEDEEEVLDPAPMEESPGHIRRPSNARSEFSDASSVFPYTVSPTQNTFTSISSVEPPSPSRLPPSPRSRNLAAQVEITMPMPPQPILIRNPSDIPRPILTPSRTRPVRHIPNKPSISSISPSIPVYIPGQPRPVGSMHRSENSVTFSSSSRSATPTFTPTSPSNDMLRSGLGGASSPFGGVPPSIPSRSVSLARSVSTRTNASITSVSSPSGSTPSRDEHTSVVNLSPNTNLLSPRLNDSILRRSPTPNASTIEEADEANSDLEDGNEHESSIGHGPPVISHVLGWKYVADAKSGSDSSGKVTSQALLGVNGPAGASQSRTVSQEGSVHDSYESHRSVRKLDSKDSLDSVFQGFVDETGLNGLGSDYGTESPDNDRLMTPDDGGVDDEDMLRGLLGVGRVEMREIQGWLVDKARKEREALRLGAEDSPLIQDSPNIPSSVFPALNPPGSTPLSPPTARRSPTSMRMVSPSTQEPEEARATSPVPPTSVPTPPMTLTDNTPMAPSREAILNAPRRAPPAPPSTATPDDIVTTPATADLLSRNNSTRAQAEDDEEKRRDFEARIAAATAALNRTPSISAARLERKGTKTKGPMVISSPTLLSSSVRLPNSPTTPPGGVDAHIAKAMEKASGSSSKMSWRWKKFKNRKGLSFSGDSADGSPVPPTPALPRKEEKGLEGPIALRKGENVPVVGDVNGNSKSPDLNAFKFPPTSASAVGSHPGMGQSVPTPPGTANPTSGLKQMMSKESKERSDHAVSTTHHVDPLTPNLSLTHSPTSSSDESAMAKFIEAGRGLGLNDEQLNEMLAAKGMLNRSTTSVSSRSFQSTAPTTNSFSHTSPSIASPVPTPVVAEKAKSGGGGGGGLFRSLSKGKKSKQDLKTPAQVEPMPSRNTIVRRTLLIPTIEAIPSTPQLPSASPAMNSESPDRLHGGRKLSVKRKPLNLSPQDRELVSSSPRKDRFGSTSTGGRDVGETGGLLHPGVAGLGLGRSDGSVGSRSSGGAGSLYDLYGDGEEEVLGSPERSRGSADGGVRASKAVEITEYADGQVVWSLVDALRDGIPGPADIEEEEEEGGEVYPVHSRSTSYASSRRESEGGSDVFASPGNGRLGKSTPGLTFRHRDRGLADGPRPETNVYFTSDADVADLIDHLSHDLNASKGRIDIHPTSSSPYPQALTAASSPFPYTTSTTSSPNPAFEDAPSTSSNPSPRKPPPAPIHTVPAGGFSPKRQMFVRQGFGAHRGLGSISGIGAGGGSGNGSGSGYGISPSQASFDSELSGGAVRTVEERLQALLDRLKESGARVGD